jgi:hypothetical protein
MTQQATDMNKIDGWLEFFGQQSVRFSVSKPEYLLNEDEGGEEGSFDYTREELSGPICISQGEDNPTIKIKGVVKFKDGTTFDEPEGGWNLLNFLSMIEYYELERRLKPENYFLGAIDRQHVLWTGMDKVDDHYVIHWDS